MPPSVGRVFLYSIVAPCIYSNMKPIANFISNFCILLRQLDKLLEPLGKEIKLVWFLPVGTHLDLLGLLSI
jgi:hypothetical protein